MGMTINMMSCFFYSYSKLFEDIGFVAVHSLTGVFISKPVPCSVPRCCSTNTDLQRRCRLVMLEIGLKFFSFFCEDRLN